MIKLWALHQLEQVQTGQAARGERRGLAAVGELPAGAAVRFDARLRLP
ncbi:MAG TPA: hypothetical protein VF527_12200 [Pyrinomonadaceae bacterium]